MEYNFYIFVLLITILSSPIAFLKNEILQNLSITEEIITVSIGIILIALFVYYFYEKKSIGYLIKKNYKIKNKLLVYILLISSTIFLGNYIVQKQGKIIRFKSFQRSLSLILMLLVGHFLFGAEITTNICLGIAIIVVGLLVIDNKIKLN
jgi:hypothetical protein